MTNSARRLSKKTWVWLFVALLMGALGYAGIRWLGSERAPLPEAVAALDSDAVVEVVKTPWLTFAPTRTTPDVGFIFYPGGRIDPQGYAPLMRAIAAEGYLVVVPEMPVNIAAFAPNRADEIRAHYPGIRYWVIGGHSVGGTMAAQYTSKHAQAIDGLVIWASYPAASADLSDAQIPIALIYGSRDPAADDASVDARRHLLPAATQYVRIDGGDHHQFGAYEIEARDHHATISPSAQHQQVIEATLGLLRSLPQDVSGMTRS